MDRVELHAEICRELNEIYKKKNHDYGNSFKKVRDEVPNAIVVRLLDKNNRLVQLMQHGDQQVDDESIEDTLKDLANYAIMELIERKIEETERLDQAVNEDKVAKPKFDFDNYKGKYAMYCGNKTEAETFCNYLESQGKKWHDGDSYEETCWGHEREKTCYSFNEDMYDNIDFFGSNGYTILEFNDFDWSEEAENE